MRKLLLPAALVFAASASAHADAPDLTDWFEKALSAVQSLVRAHRLDRDVIAAPKDLDRKMALTPPRDGSHMRVITPPR